MLFVVLVGVGSHLLADRDNTFSAYLCGFFIVVAFHIYVLIQAELNLKVPFHWNHFMGSLCHSKISSPLVGT